MKSSTPPFLDDPPRLLLFGGRGGVGKTTCAAAAALLLARSSPGKSFRLISADPAHSLWDSLADCGIPDNLTVVELDAKQRTDAFRAAERGRLREIAAAGTFLDGSDIDRLLDLSLPGLDELGVFLEISDLLEHVVCDCIVVDTAPSGHTLRLLTIPENIRLWVEALDALLAKRRYMMQIFGREDSVRADNEDPLELLIAGWNAALDRMETLLRDPLRCRFVPVTTAGALGVEETARLWKELQRLGVPVSDVIVNQVHLAGGCPACTRDFNLETVQAAGLAAIFRPARLWAVELFAEEVRGERMLTEFWLHARPVETEASDTAALEVTPPIEPSAGLPADLPSPRMQLLLFSGKGGVGKTTLACATALRMARDFPSNRVLLVSTDPAHSLSCCLRIAVGSRPTAVFSNLAAMEIDARAEFELLRRRYERDVDELALTDSGAFDLPFDRAVIEKVLQLAPPGLDEVMALTGLIDLLAQHRYDLFVVDSASTGHFIRLLELPPLIEEWLSSLFGILLKYKRLLHLPRFTDHLILLSRNLKTFRKILADSTRSALYAVSIPTLMALEETKDLLAACGRIGLGAPLVFLNRLTPPGGCRLCAAQERRESLVARRFERALRDHRLVRVYRRAGLAGTAGLLDFASVLYQTPDREMCPST